MDQVIKTMPPVWPNTLAAKSVGSHNKNNPLIWLCKENQREDWISPGKEVLLSSTTELDLGLRFNISFQFAPKDVCLIMWCCRVWKTLSVVCSYSQMPSIASMNRNNNHFMSHNLCAECSFMPGITWELDATKIRGQRGDISPRQSAADFAIAGACAGNAASSVMLRASRP